MLARTFYRCIVGAALATSVLCVSASARASEPVAPTVDPLETAPAPGPAPAPEQPRTRGLVASGTLGVAFLPVYPVPSGELSLFLGGTLPIKTFRASHWLALGYRGTVGVGYADILIGNLVALRHHLALQGAAGKRGRFYFGVSAGVAQFPGLENAGDGGRHSVFALEGEGRLGGLFGAGDLKFLFGAQIRLTGAVMQFHSDTMIPTIGLFFGVNFGRRR